MERKILFGSIIATIILMMLPTIPAVEYSVVKDTNNSFQTEQIKDYDIKELEQQLKEKINSIQIKGLGGKLFTFLWKILVKIINLILGIIGTVLNIAGSVITTLFSIVVNIITGLIKNILNLGSLLSKFIDILASILNGIFSIVISILIKIFNVIKQIINIILSPNALKN